MQGCKVSLRVSGYSNDGRSTEYEKATQKTASRQRRPNGVLNHEKKKDAPSVSRKLKDIDIATKAK
jgi:hypothetical protein